MWTDQTKLVWIWKTFQLNMFDKFDQSPANSITSIACRGFIGSICIPCNKRVFILIYSTIVPLNFSYLAIDISLVSKYNWACQYSTYLNRSNLLALLNNRLLEHHHQTLFAQKKFLILLPKEGSCIFVCYDKLFDWIQGIFSRRTWFVGYKRTLLLISISTIELFN